MEIWYEETRTIDEERHFFLRLDSWYFNTEMYPANGARVLSWWVEKWRPGRYHYCGWYLEGKLTQEIIPLDTHKPEAIRMAIARFDELVKEYEM